MASSNLTLAWRELARGITCQVTGERGRTSDHLQTEGTADRRDRGGEAGGVRVFRFAGMGGGDLGGSGVFKRRQLLSPPGFLTGPVAVWRGTLGICPILPPPPGKQLLHGRGRNPRGPVKQKEGAGGGAAWTFTAARCAASGCSATCTVAKFPSPSSSPSLHPDEPHWPGTGPVASGRVP